MANIIDMFTDENMTKKIQDKLPFLFQLAELESSRAGKIGMEVGVLRERILVALLIYKFGETNVETEIPTTEPEVDVIVHGNPISIKTITGSLGGVKLIWTVDADKSLEFRENYRPTVDMLLTHITWGSRGGIYYIPKDAQRGVFERMGRDEYIKLPKPGTNPRGVEITKNALISLVNHNLTRKIMIDWQKSDIDYKPYKRWLDYWRED